MPRLPGATNDSWMRECALYKSPGPATVIKDYQEGAFVPRDEDDRAKTAPSAHTSGSRYPRALRIFCNREKIEVCEVRPPAMEIRNK